MTLWRSLLWLQALENRMAPAAGMTLVSRTDPSFFTTSGGASFADSRAISHDGRFTVFSSSYTNLVSGQLDTNKSLDVFLYDRVTGAIQLVSHASGSTTMTGNGFSYTDPSAISADGTVITFLSTATNLVTG